MKHILVTGGAGYIGSHTIIELLQNNYKVTVVDNLSNSSRQSLRRVEKLTGKKVDLVVMDVRDYAKLSKLFKQSFFDGVIHFAGLKAVGESVARPLDYYDNNITSTLVLTKIMQQFNVRQLVFSSSATVYGNPKSIPIPETETIKPTNPYGQTKAMIEQILTDLSRTNQDWRITLLRYFNPIGADSSGQIGEDPQGIPNNLMPSVSQAAVGKLPLVKVFGNDYDTPDGTGVRDYIHVVDLAKGHLAAINRPAEKNKVLVYNLGTGVGYSVMEVIATFEQVSGRKIPYKIYPRRPGDIATCYADPTKAENELGWRTTKSLADACEDTWRWQSLNPNGYN